MQTKDITSTPSFVSPSCADLTVSPLYEIEGYQADLQTALQRAMGKLVEHITRWGLIVPASFTPDLYTLEGVPGTEKGCCGDRRCLHYSHGEWASDYRLAPREGAFVSVLDWQGDDESEELFAHVVAGGTTFFLVKDYRFDYASVEKLSLEEATIWYGNTLETRREREAQEHASEQTRREHTWARNRAALIATRPQRPRRPQRHQHVFAPASLGYGSSQGHEDSLSASFQPSCG